MKNIVAEAGGQVCFWHKADIPTRPTNIRFWGNSGHAPKQFFMGPPTGMYRPGFVWLRPDAFPPKPHRLCREPAPQPVFGGPKPKHPGRGWLAGVNQGNYAGDETRCGLL